MAVAPSLGRRLSLTPPDALQLGSQKFKTKVIKRNLNPIWQEEFYFTCSEGEEMLHAYFQYASYAWVWGEISSLVQ